MAVCAVCDIWWTNVIFESDFLRAINLIKDSGQWFALDGVMVEKIRMLSSNRIFLFQYRPSEQNYSAHAIANFAIGYNADIFGVLLCHRCL